MIYKVYQQVGSELFGASISVTDTCVANATTDRYGSSVAFVRRGGGKWRAIEWFAVPEDVKDALFEKACVKVDNAEAVL